MIYVTNIYGYNLMYVVCYSKLLRILLMCNVVNSLLNLSKYLRINYHKLFWTPRIVNGRILIFWTCFCLFGTGFLYSVLCRINGECGALAYNRRVAVSYVSGLSIKHTSFLCVCLADWWWPYNAAETCSES